MSKRVYPALLAAAVALVVLVLLIDPFPLPVQEGYPDPTLTPEEQLQEAWLDLGGGDM